MSHLHRGRAANLSIASDFDTCHPCKPTLAKGEVTVAELREEVAAAAAPASARAAKRPAAKKRSKR